MPGGTLFIFQRTPLTYWRLFFDFQRAGLGAVFGGEDESSRAPELGDEDPLLLLLLLLSRLLRGEGDRELDAWMNLSRKWSPQPEAAEDEDGGDVGEDILLFRDLLLRVGYWSVRCLKSLVI